MTLWDEVGQKYRQILRHRQQGLASAQIDRVETIMLRRKPSMRKKTVHSKPPDARGENDRAYDMKVAVKSQFKVNESRRNFLKGLGFGGAGLAATALLVPYLQKAGATTPTTTATQLAALWSALNPWAQCLWVDQNNAPWIQDGSDGQILLNAGKITTVGAARGAGTAGATTTTLGFSEMLGVAKEQDVLVIRPGYQQSTSVSNNITKNVTVMAWGNGWPEAGQSAPVSNEVGLGNVSITASAEALWNVALEGLGMQTLLFNSNPNYISGTKVRDCTVFEGVTYEGASGQVCDQTVFDRCELAVENTTTTGTPLVDVTNQGSNNVNQTFFINSFLELPYSVTGAAYLFLVNAANFYPVVTGCQIHIAQSNLTLGTFLKCEGSGVNLLANMKNNYTEFHSPFQIIEALSGNTTDPIMIVDWDNFMNALANGNNLVNITVTSSTYCTIRLKGGIQTGVTVANGTWPQGGETMDVSIHMPISTNRAFYMSVSQPAVPGGTGSGHKVTNSFTQKARIYLTSAVSAPHIVDVMGNDEAIDSPTLVPIELDPGEEVYFATTAPTTWLWYGID